MKVVSWWTPVSTRDWPTFAGATGSRWPVDPASLDAVVLTHAHLDHCGYLPKLVRDGFRGPVVCTPQTAALAAIVLRDSAHLQEEDAEYANRAGFSRHRPALPLYGEADVDQTLPLLQPLAYERSRELRPGLSVKLRTSGHILGSSTAQVTADGTETLFSGDLGVRTIRCCSPRLIPPKAHTIVVESTYGDRSHPQPDEEILASAVRRTAARGGSVLVPAFAVDRTELVLLELHRLLVAGRIPRLRSTSTARWRWRASRSTAGQRGSARAASGATSRRTSSTSQRCTRSTTPPDRSD